MVERIAERLQPMLLFLVYGAIGAILAGASSGSGWHGGMDDMGMLRGASLCSCTPQHTAASAFLRFDCLKVIDPLT